MKFCILAQPVHATPSSGFHLQQITVTPSDLLRLFATAYSMITHLKRSLISYSWLGCKYPRPDDLTNWLSS